VLNTPDYIVSAGHDTQVLWGCLLDFVNALAGIGSAVAVFPIARRVSESLALGFVTSRIVEGAVIIIGVVALLTVVVMRQDFAASGTADHATLVTTGNALVTTRNWTFLLGPDVMPCINAAMFATLLYRSRLVPRVIPSIGLIGAPMLLASSMLTFFGHNTLTSGWAMLATLPIATWELSIGVYMLTKGFKYSPRAEAAA
jgi:hypothetical protein